MTNANDMARQAVKNTLKRTHSLDIHKIAQEEMVLVQVEFYGQMDPVDLGHYGKSLLNSKGYEVGEFTPSELGMDPDNMDIKWVIGDIYLDQSILKDLKGAGTFTIDGNEVTAIIDIKN